MHILQSSILCTQHSGRKRFMGATEQFNKFLKIQIFVTVFVRLLE